MRAPETFFRAVEESKWKCFDSQSLGGANMATNAINREERLRILKEFDDFTDDINQKIDGILEKLNWDRETVLKNYEKQEKCKQKPKKADVQFSEDYQEFYKGRIPSLSIDKELQAKIIEDAKKANPEMLLMLPVQDLNTRKLPESNEDILFDFSREEKLVLYEYAAEKLKNPPEQEKSYPLKMPEESSSKSMTFADVVDMERQLKRRRMKHRTTKEPPLSYSETIRKLINTQTDAWKSFLHQNEDSRKHHKHKRSKHKHHKRRRSQS
ncbi:uncharacterized protein LOC132265395 [Phlebotomus argentipes]|uniref:uncharacterized protein LOC132265395 n=1 Tax=Phlebotomus argentipes TaxID=94469 RepID=UPI002892ABC8|nr:uncharacterized protein LOC132265395 [Phlebotomus argentipes]